MPKSWQTRNRLAMSKEITLCHGEIVIIDDEDYGRVSCYSWHYDSGRRALAHIGGKCVPMHRFILNAPKGVEVDHINHDTLDNRKCNLRLVTKSQNMQNMLGHIDGSSKYKGVSLHQCGPARSYHARIMKDHKQNHLGAFSTQEAAALAYNKAATELFGEYACLNEIGIDS